MDESTKPLLSDAELAETFPAVARLVSKLEGTAARDPSQGVQDIARALAEYFRTPDAQ